MYPAVIGSEFKRLFKSVYRLVILAGLEKCGTEIVMCVGAVQLIDRSLIPQAMIMNKLHSGLVST